MKVFLTGATGLLGIHLTRALLAAGYQVRAVVRNPQKANQVLPSDPNLELVSGDLLNTDDLLPHLEGCDATILGGALFTEYYEVGGSDWNMFNAVNVQGTLSLLRAAKAAGHQKAVFVSSSGALADEHNALLNESQVTDLYRRSKIVGEKMIRADQALTEFPIIIVRPGWIFGPDDPTPTTTGRFSRELVSKKRIEMVSGAPGPVVDARDVADGIVRSLATVNRNDAFNLVGHNIPSGEALRMISRQVPGSKVVLFPLFMAAAMSRILEIKVRALGGVNHMPLEGLRFLARPQPVSNEHAARTLGIRFRPFEETARDVAAWAMEVEKSSNR